MLLPDSGRSYLSKIYNDEWMRVNGLLATTGAVVRVGDLLDDRHHAGHAGGRRGPDDAARRRRDRDRSRVTGSASCRCPQTPDDDAIDGLVGSISEKGLLDRAFRDPSIVERTVGEVMDRPAAAGRPRREPRRGVRAAVR